ncbi:MAG: conjugative transfer ATPase [Candidatus Sedimenticola endophacoides]
MNKPRRARQSDFAAMYRRPPSFTDLLPWAEYIPSERCFLLEDGRSVGAVLDLEPVGCEARPPQFLSALHEGLLGVLSSVVEHDPAPWVCQFFVQDDLTLSGLIDQMRDYGTARDLGGLTEEWLSIMQAHTRRLARPGGIFEDKEVTGSRWGARIRHTRLVIYRRFKREEQAISSTLEQISDQIVRLRASLEAAGVRSRLADGRDVHDWLLRWFNPAPAVCDGDPTRLGEIAPYPGDEDLPFGRDFAEMLTLSMPESDAEAGLWRFDGLPHTILSMQALRRVPDIGLFTTERRFGDKVYSLFDRMPPGTVMALTLEARPQDILRQHVATIKRAAIGDGAEAVLARENASDVEIAMAKGDRLIPASLSFYVNAPDELELRRRCNHISSILLHNGVQTIVRESDLLPIDAWVRNLPMNHDPVLDRSSRRSRLVFGSHVARMLPLYGRSRGTGHPGFVFWNRGGEPLTFDPLNRLDRKKNGHMLVLGPTGAGKSATLVYLILQMMAMWKPRVYLIEAGNSFGLLCDYLRAQGMNVHDVTMKPGTDVSLPPFAGALSLLEQNRSTLDDLDSVDDAEEDTRDLLGEMEIAARIMITGGEAGEDAKMSRADRLLIREAILAAARTVKDAHGDQVLTEDVAAALRKRGKDERLEPRRRERAADMADAMQLFCSGLAGDFFNRPGKEWPDADVTHLEMGILAREGYEDQLTVAFTALMNHINGVVEANQHQHRPTLVITDEGHIITTNPLLAPYVIKITKMWRKYGAWFWIATQNLEDFPEASKRMLNMLEWWLCLVMPKEEVEQIARFRALSDEQRSLLLSARKEPGKYTEGVVLTDAMAALFRNVPPAIALALAQTEQHEKAARAELMAHHDCSEVEAALMVAERIDAERTEDAS